MALRLGCLRWRGRLDEPVAPEGMIQHLARCATCRAERARRLALVRDLGRLRDNGPASPDPDAVRRRVFARFDAALAQGAGAPAALLWAGSCLAAAVLASVCALLVPLLPPEGVLPDDAEMGVLCDLHTVRAEAPLEWALVGAASGASRP